MIKTQLLLERIRPLIAVVLFIAALYLAHHELKVHSIEEIFSALGSFPVKSILLSMSVVVISYLSLTSYDFLALRYLNKKIPALRVVLASLISFSISNNTGYAYVTGPSLRYRFYGSSGLSGVDIIKFTLFCSLMNLLGMVSLWSFSCITGKSVWMSTMPMPHVLTMSGWLAAALLTGYLLFVFFRKKAIVIHDMDISVPSFSLTIAQMFASAIELLMASLVLYILLKVHIDISFTHFLFIYMASMLLGLFSQIPGGLGVFEGTFLYLMNNVGSASYTVAALLIYRVLYYFSPLILAGAALLVYEINQHKNVVTDKASNALAFLSRSVPHIFSILLTLSGVLLLVSDSTPTAHGALNLLIKTLPLSVVETSHLVASIIGVLLLFLARAVHLRLDAAYIGVVVLLALGSILTFLKGYDWQEALVLIAMLLLFLPTRSYYYRKSSLLNMSLSPSWISMMAIILLGTVWIGLFSYSHVEYSNELWWKFSYQGDVHRFFRSTLTLMVLLVGFGLYRLLRVSPVKDQLLPTSEEIDQLEPIITKAIDTQGHLALLGDKYILWSQSKKSFLMYDTTQKFWIAMGDPVGPTEEHEELIWQFLEMANKRGARIAFYQVSRHLLPLYIDLGLILIKMGEEARIPLASFGLEGNKRANLRQTYNRFTKFGMQFEVLERDEVVARFDELKKISDSWMTTKKAKEKKFSLGFFDKDYISRTRVGIITQNNEIIAFANLWELSTGEEISADLMRFIPEAPNGLMEFLLIQLMLWAKNEDYRWFNIGMAPLAGLEKHPLAPVWHKVGNIVFEHGESFYNFEGLHAYKEKFTPVWEPRYLATPAMKAPAVLLSVTTIIAGNWKGVFKK
ncbi:MAG: bifunctional lysylphosphatidylglycerol flippase/synthetase MprF [Kiritimatiellae bacterium]|jgi:phosphatidylglycerol lysyltransferase|nr:bifunctional lysylphosphatidylglycerol flippase/synthetase MprF [Kiritimatiellia bacterium]